ncbi:MAG: VWA domain-containing protein [bacterium]|nr:VWA domain-containing protein [bacterium]
MNIQSLIATHAGPSLMSRSRRPVASRPAIFQGVGGLLRRIARSSDRAREHARGKRAIPSDGTDDSVLVIDVSFSMDDPDYAPTRLEAAKEAGQKFARRLAQNQPDAHLAVIAYADDAHIVCSLTKARRIDRILEAINGMSTSGNTNITAGLKAARRELALTPRRGHVVLLSDGHHNTGDGPAAVADILKQHAEISCVGIGGSRSQVDEPLMRAIASCYPNGKKRYRWIGDTEGLIQHFEDLAGGITRE